MTIDKNFWDFAVKFHNQISKITLLDIHLRAGNISGVVNMMKLTTPRQWAELCNEYAQNNQDVTYLKSMFYQTKQKLKEANYKLWLTEFGPKMMALATEFGAEVNRKYLSYQDIASLEENKNPSKKNTFLSK